MNLLVGGNGLIGTAVRQELERHNLSLIATSRRSLDLEHPELYQIGIYDVAYLVAGITGYKNCEGNPLAWRVNVDATIMLARQCKRQGAFVVFMSSEAVEWSNSGYARQKAQVESYINTIDGAIIRPGKVMRDNVAELAAFIVDIGNKRAEGVHRWSKD